MARGGCLLPLDAKAKGRLIMTDYEIYVFLLCLIVFLLLTALSVACLAIITKLSLRLIKCGEEDKKILEEYKKSKTKRVVINKNDLNIDVEDEVFIVTLNQFQMLEKTIKDKKIKINNLENDLKKSLENNESAISDLKKEIQQLKQKSIDNALSINDEHQSELNNLKHIHETEIKKINDAHQTEINQIKADKTMTANKEYLDKYNDAIDEKNKIINEKEDLEKEINMLRNTRFNYASQYNALLNDIKSISWFDAVRNKHKDILNNHQLIQIPIVDEASMIDADKTD